MALSTRPRKDEDEEILEEDAEETEAGTTAPAISDRRRRRMLAQGLDPDAAPTSVAREEKHKRDDGEEKRKREDRGGNFITRFVEGIRDYFLDVRSELKKVAWPSREEIDRLTRIVLAVTAIFALSLGAVSFIFGWLTTQIAVKDWGTVAGLVTIAIIIVVAVLWLIRDRLFPNYE